MNEPKYLVLDKNLVPMIYKNVRGEIVKCCLQKPISASIYLLDNLFLTEQEIREYDERLLNFMYRYWKENIYDFKVEKVTIPCD